MGRYEKLYTQIITIGNRKNISFDDLRYFVEHIGGKERSIRGSHHVYVIDGIARPIPLEPDKNGMARDYQIREVQKAVKEIEKGGEGNA